MSYYQTISQNTLAAREIELICPELTSGNVLQPIVTEPEGERYVSTDY